MLKYAFLNMNTLASNEKLLSQNCSQILWIGETEYRIFFSQLWENTLKVWKIFGLVGNDANIFL